MTGNLDYKDFYFSEIVKQPFMKNGLSGEIVIKGKVIIEACNTDWNRWNGHGENIKTAAVYRSEREAKETGNALVKVEVGSGEIYLLTLDLLSLKADGEELIKTLLKNRGVQLIQVQDKSRKALSQEANLERARIVNAADIQNQKPEKMDNALFGSNFETAKEQNIVSQWKVIQSNAQGFLDFERNGFNNTREKQEVYLSFWLFSPRSLINLLVEPDIPKLNMVFENRNDFSLSINGIAFNAGVPHTTANILENLPLEKGWNHILLKMANLPGKRGWKTKIRFESNSGNYLSQLKSSVGQ